MRAWLTARTTTRALDWTFGCVKQPIILSWLHWPRTPASQAYVEHVFSVCGDLTTGKGIASQISWRTGHLLK